MRDLIIKALERRRWTAYRLAKAVAGRVPEQSVYAYIGERSDIMAESLLPIIEALGLEIREKR